MDNNFYKRYEEEYVQDSNVRKAHQWIFDIIVQYPTFNSVVDLGCGESQEFRRFFKPAFYTGVDNNPNLTCNRIGIDYRTVSDWSCIYPETTAFVSLFSTEITAQPASNYRLYESLFRNPQIRAGLVSGFFYNDHRKYKGFVVEEGGIESYQTIEPIGTRESDLFEERRIYLPVPSKMFGPAVIEVWKLFLRRA